MGRFSYTPSQIKRMPEKQVRKLYAEYRKIANKRAARLRGAGFGEYEAAQVYFTPTKNLTEAQVKAAFADVNMYLRDVRTKIKPLRAYESNQIETLHEHGYDFITKENFKQFTDFMEWAKARAGSNDRVFKSDRVAELFEQKERLKISANALQKNFDHYLENLDKIKDVAPLKNTSRAMSDRELSSRIRKVKK